ncbi:adenine phosphoribosyltransferase, partial [Exiguobacterium sp. A1_3_1]
MEFKQHIKEVENWPKEGISFKDITSLMQNGPVYKQSVDALVEYARSKGCLLYTSPSP